LLLLVVVVAVNMFIRPADVIPMEALEAGWVIKTTTQLIPAVHIPL
jgi:hypothetical protein